MEAQQTLSTSGHQLKGLRGQTINSTEALAAHNDSLRARRLRVHSIGSLADAPGAKARTG